MQNLSPSSRAPAEHFDLLLTAREMFGEACELAIVKHLGGRDLYIARVQHEKTELGRAIGTERAQALADLFFGTHVEIRSRRTAVEAKRAAEALQLKRKGKTIHAIGRRFGVTDRHVFRVLRRARELETAANSGDRASQ